MNRIAVAAALGVLSLIFLSAPALTQGKKETTKGMLPQGWKNLDLSKEQVLNIYSIQSKYKGKIKALEDQIKSLRVEERQEMFRVLTDDQKALARKLLVGEEGPAPKSKESKKDAKKEEKN